MAAIQVPPDSTGKRVDTVTLTDALVEVHRQKMVVTGGSGTAEVVVVTNAAPAGTDMGLVVRHAGTATVAGTVNVNGGVAISGTAQVAISTPFTVNNISATVVVSGLVGLTAGTAVIGDINAISRTVQVAVGTPFTVNNISATVTVAGNVNISTMPAVTIAAGQTINDISRTVNVAIGTPFTIQGISTTVTTVVSTIRKASEVPSVSHGPRCVTASTSANVSFVAAPGVGLAIYVTSLAASNAGAVGSRARVGSSATPGNVTMFMASAGGGFVMQFEPPWQLSANEALLCSVKPNTSDGLFNVHFFVASADAF